MKYVAAIREAEIPHDGMLFNNHTYAPQWVREAIKLYDHNPDYAGMNLVEFLRRMRPESEVP